MKVYKPFTSLVVSSERELHSLLLRFGIRLRHCLGKPKMVCRSVAVADLPARGVDLSSSALLSCSSAFAAVLLGLCNSFGSLLLALLWPLQRPNPVLRL